MSGSDPPIIITGGSVTIDLGSSYDKFQHDGEGKHHNAEQKIQRIVVTGDGIDINETVPAGNVTIKIYYG